MVQKGIIYRRASNTILKEQRALVHARIIVFQLQDLRGWQLHALNVRTNHDPRHRHLRTSPHRKWLRQQLKAWTSRRLSEQAGLTGKSKDPKDMRKLVDQKAGVIAYINKLKNNLMFFTETDSLTFSKGNSIPARSASEVRSFPRIRISGWYVISSAIAAPPPPSSELCHARRSRSCWTAHSAPASCAPRWVRSQDRKRGRGYRD